MNTSILPSRFFSRKFIIDIDNITSGRSQVHAKRWCRSSKNGRAARSIGTAVDDRDCHKDAILAGNSHRLLDFYVDSTKSDGHVTSRTSPWNFAHLPPGLKYAALIADSAVCSVDSRRSGIMGETKLPDIRVIGLVSLFVSAVYALRFAVSNQT
jgi:hypothetical protein